MEPAKIDWETIDSVFIKDDLYEHIKAPKWVDFSAPFDNNNLLVADDQSWFCRPDCNHPKTVEDLLLLKVAPKVQRPTTVSEIVPMGDRNRRDANLKRRPGLARPLLSSNKGTKSDKFVIEDGENMNPNLHLTPSHQYNHMKSVIRSSTENKSKSNKKKENDKSPHRQKLKSTLSARNLFGGRDIVNHISEFCNELKRLAMRTKEREILLEKEEEKRNESLGKKNTVVEEEEVKVGSKMKVEETENAPPTSVDLKLKKKKNNKDVAAIATCPPSPQCFSAGRGLTTATLTPPLKPASKSRLQVRGILQELDQKNKKLSKEELVDHNTSPVVLEREGPTALDVFWFLKPCTNLSS